MVSRCRTHRVLIILTLLAPLIAGAAPEAAKSTSTFETVSRGRIDNTTRYDLGWSENIDAPEGDHFESRPDDLVMPCSSSELVDFDYAGSFRNKRAYLEFDLSSISTVAVSAVRLEFRECNAMTRLVSVNTSWGVYAFEPEGPVDVADYDRFGHTLLAYYSRSVSNANNHSDCRGDVQTISFNPAGVAYVQSALKGGAPLLLGLVSNKDAARIPPEFNDQLTYGINEISLVVDHDGNTPVVQWDVPYLTQVYYRNWSTACMPTSAAMVVNYMYGHEFAFDGATWREVQSIDSYRTNGQRLYAQGINLGQNTLQPLRDYLVEWPKNGFPQYCGPWTDSWGPGGTEVYSGSHNGHYDGDLTLTSQPVGLNTQGYWPYMKSVLERHGLFCESLAAEALSDAGLLRAAVARGPVIISTDFDGLGGDWDGHVVVLIGTTAGGDFIVHDPWGDNLMSGDWAPSDDGAEVVYPYSLLHCSGRWGLLVPIQENHESTDSRYSGFSPYNLYGHSDLDFRFDGWGTVSSSYDGDGVHDFPNRFTYRAFDTSGSEIESTTGWQYYFGTGGYGFLIGKTTGLPGQVTNRASWELPVQATGRYRLAAGFYASGENSPDVPYDIYRDDQLIAQFRIDQSRTEEGTTGFCWEDLWLGLVLEAGQTLRVEIRNDTDTADQDINVDSIRGSYLGPVDMDLVGHFPNGWHADGTSQAFLDAYYRFKDASGEMHALGDPWDNGGGPYVHEFYGMYIQDFYGTDNGLDHPWSALIGAMVTEPQQGEYEVRQLSEGFWSYWMGNAGWVSYGRPISDEITTGPLTVQLFEKNGDIVSLVWDGLSVSVEDFAGTPIIPASVTFTAGGAVKTASKDDGVYHSARKVTDFGLPIELRRGTTYDGFYALLGGETIPIASFTIEGDASIPVGSNGPDIYRAVTDTYIRHDYNNLCGSGWIMDGGSIISVMTWESINRTARSLLTFDLGELPAAPPVERAVLRLFAIFETEYATNDWHVSRITENWDPALVTWCSRADGAEWCEEGGCLAAEGTSTVTIPSTFEGGNGNPNRFLEFDVTDIVRAWQQGVPNHGVCVWQEPRYPGGSNQEIQFVASEHADGAVLGPRILINPCGPPLPLVPEDGATCIATTATLDWSDLSCATGYEVQVGRTSGTGTVYAANDSEQVVGGLLPSALHYWRVRSRNATGTWSVWSPVHSFRTAAPSPQDMLRRLPSADTVVRRDYDDLCGGRYRDAGGAIMPVYTRESMSRTSRALMHFDICDLVAQALVESATLRLYALYETEYSTNEFHASRVIEDWEPDVSTWCARLPQVPWTTSGVSLTGEGEAVTVIPSLVEGGYGAYDEYIDFDVTAIVHAWQQGAPCDGICVWQSPVAGGNQEIGFASSEHPEAATRGPVLLIDSSARNTAYGLDGNGQCLLVPAQPAMDLPDDLSFECWAQFEALPTPGNQMVLVAKDDTSTPGTRGYAFKLNCSVTGELALEFQFFVDGVMHFAQEPWFPVLGRWHHLAVTRNRDAGAVKFYVDGYARGTAHLLSTAAIQVVASDLTIGARFGPGQVVADCLLGAIDEVRISSVVRSPLEIAQYRIDGWEMPSDQATIGSWHMDGSAGSDAKRRNAAGASELNLVEIGAPSSVPSFGGSAGLSVVPPLDLETSDGLSAHPNPFNPSVTLSYVLPSRIAVSLRIFDLRGRLVCVLEDDVIREGGLHEVTWRGTDAAGRTVPSGTYMCRLEAGPMLVTRRVTLLK